MDHAVRTTAVHLLLRHPPVLPGCELLSRSPEALCRQLLCRTMEQGPAIELRKAALFESHDGADDADEVDVERAPICGACGVTTLAADAFGSGFACDNDECSLYGELVT